MSGGDFFDTNVFIYLFDDADARKQAIAQSLVSRALAAGDAAISFQVVQETLHVLTRKFTRQVTPEVAAQILQNSLLPLWRVQPSPALYARALALQERYAFSFYDSLIIAAALEAGSQRLLTEDLHNGQQIDGLTIHNPFTDSFTD
ncbi:MAG: PIN domain-containing protein [Gammaproteobacteria bacterium]|nr:PIN domain-containing protein [Gammaproteobacteria bacterium]